MTYSNTIGVIETFNGGSSLSRSSGILLPSGGNSVGFLIQALSGNMTGLVLNIEVSDDGSVWYESTYSSGVMGKHGNTCITIDNFPYDYARIVVGTASSVASSIKITAVGR